MTSGRLMSHWQRGCDDARAGRGPRRPFPSRGPFARNDYDEQLANRGYMNGWRFGVQHQPVTTQEAQSC